MRTTLNIDERILRHMKSEAEKAGISLTELANRALELGLQRLAPVPERESPSPLTFSLGQARFNIDKALEFAAELEDQELVRKLDLRK